MNKTLLLLNLSFISIFAIGQSNKQLEDDWLISKISDEICVQLENDDIPTKTEEFVNTIFFLTVEKYREQWNKKLDGFPNSGSESARNSYYYQLIDHRLQFSCNSYTSVFHFIDKTLKDNPTGRKLHLALRSLIISAEMNSNPAKLKTEHFEQNAVEISTLNSLMLEIEKCKLASGLLITSTNKGLNYYVSWFDYKTGEDYIAFKAIFKDTNNELIDEFELLDRSELNANTSDLEFDEDEFIDMPLPPLPPPSKKEKNER